MDKAEQVFIKIAESKADLKKGLLQGALPAAILGGAVGTIAGHEFKNNAINESNIFHENAADNIRELDKNIERINAKIKFHKALGTENPDYFAHLYKSLEGHKQQINDILNETVNFVEEVPHHTPLMMGTLGATLLAPIGYGLWYAHHKSNNNFSDDSTQALKKELSLPGYKTNTKYKVKSW